MRSLRVLLVLPLLLVLHPRGAVAQNPRGGAPVPFVGLGVGGANLPDAFAGCSTDARSVGEIRAGVSFGALTVEGRGAALLAGMDQCLLALPEEVYVPGIHRVVEYPFTRGDTHASGELRLRFGLPSGLPLVVAGGAGWLAPQDVPYLLVSAGFRTRGRVRLAMDLDANWFRVPYDAVVREFGFDGIGGPALSSESSHDWRRGLGIRLGAELPLR